MTTNIQETTNFTFRKRRKSALHPKSYHPHTRPFDPVAYAAALEILG